MCIYAVCLSAIVLYLHGSDVIASSTQADLHLLFPALQLLGALCILTHCGRPKTVPAVLLFVIGILIFLAAFMMLRNSSALWWFRHTLAVLLRVLIVLGWGMTGLGFVLIFHTIRRGTIHWHRFAPRLVRISFAAILVTLSLEVVAFALAPSAESMAALPHLPPAAVTNNRLIAAIGGSTMVGFPYAPKFGFAQVAMRELHRRYPDHNIEFQNLAVTGANLALAAAQLEKLERYPDVLLVYSGHNEFFHDVEELTVSRQSSFGAIDRLLKWSPTFRVVNPILSQYLMSSRQTEPDRPFPGPSLCTPEKREARLKKYRAQIQQLFAWTKSNEVRVVFCVPASGEAGLEPNQSTCEGASAEERAWVKKCWHDIRDFQRSGDDQEALKLCDLVLDRFPDTAEILFRAGECLRRIGRHQEALRHFRKARATDQYPIRMLPEYRHEAVLAAESTGAQIIRSASLFRPLSDDGILDSTLFPDGVHPSLACCFVLGTRVADVIASKDLLRLGAPRQLEVAAGFADCIHDLEFDVHDLAEACRTTADVLEHYCMFRSFDPEARMLQSSQLRRLADALRNGDIDPGQEETESLKQLTTSASD